MRLKFTKFLKKKRSRKREPLHWGESKDIDLRIGVLIENCKFGYIDNSRVFTYRSQGAKTRAYARIWGLGRIFQQALRIPPAYVIEVISEKFDRLPEIQQDMILIHELLHIPKTFSGALVPHKHKGGVNEHTVRKIYSSLKANKR